MVTSKQKIHQQLFRQSKRVLFPILVVCSVLVISSQQVIYAICDGSVNIKTINPTAAPVPAGTTVGGFYVAFGYQNSFVFDYTVTNDTPPASGNYTSTYGNNNGSNIVAYTIPTDEVCTEATITSVRVVQSRISPSDDYQDGLFMSGITNGTPAPTSGYVDIGAMGGTTTTAEGTPFSSANPLLTNLTSAAGAMRANGSSATFFGVTPSSTIGTLDYTVSGSFTKADVDSWYINTVAFGLNTVLTQPSITVTYDKSVCPNTNPVVNPDTITTQSGESTTFPVIDNDSDPDNDALTVTQIDNQPATVGVPITLSDGSGTAVLNSDNTVTYTPSDGFVGQTTINYTVDDCRGGILSSTITISSTTPNPAPPLTPDTGLKNTSSYLWATCLLFSIPVLWIIRHKKTGRRNSKS